MLKTACDTISTIFYLFRWNFCHEEILCVTQALYKKFPKFEKNTNRWFLGPISRYEIYENIKSLFAY